MAEALIVAERMREQVGQEPFMYEGRELHVTISMGLTEVDPDRDSSKKDFINRADQALYMSKNSGRNRVCFL
jgi:diguanylate cyclase (GGDEF)-like protein